MRARVKTLTVGTILATATLISATAATSQTLPDSGLDITNDQLQLGDVFSGQTLNVVENYDVLRVETEALGNGMTGGNDQVDARLRSTQSLEGNVTASAIVNGLAEAEAYRTSLGTPL